MKPVLKDLGLIVDLLRSHPAINLFISRLNNNRHLSVSNLLGAAISVLLKEVSATLNVPILCLTNSLEEAENIYQNLYLFFNRWPLGYLPNPLPDHPAALFSEKDSSWEFFTAQTLDILANSNNAIVVAPITAIDCPLPSRINWQELNITINVSSQLDRAALFSQLDMFGYQRVELVENRLDYCVKGGIIDIFPANSPYPIRIEMEDNVVASLRIFNPDSQLSIRKIEHLVIKPSVSFLERQSSSFLTDYLPSNTIIFSWADASKLGDTWVHSFWDNNPESKIVFANDFLHPTIDFGVFKYFPLRTFQDFRRHLSTKLSDNHPNHSFFVFCDSAVQVERLDSLLRDIPSVEFVLGHLAESIEVPTIGLYLYSDADIFKREYTPSLFRRLVTEIPAVPLNLNEIAPGDYLVHIDYGIGRFLKMDKILAFGAMHECLVLEYADRAKVYVPVEKANLVHKYKGTEGYVPRLSRLGSGDWEKTKLRTRRTIYQQSEEIINLYARRMHSIRPAYPPDTDLQLQLESSFWFEETPDQIQATAEIKHDLELERPMDRLLCGDVGFGKTEVAIRAAFKVVSASRQVAVLAPTTILADQHFAVFSRRLKDFPVRIGILNRFIPRKEQAQTLRDVAIGKIDILIGTHRILSPDVVFRDLGLLIIDEEHRFGVKDKEKLKMLRESLDVLSLSATPIPRSLYLSLIGARDMSLIHTPPKARLPILTEVIHFDPGFIRAAVQREIQRGGQVFFVHNDIASIAHFTNKIRTLFPDLPVAFAHGQMRERELETIMRGFIEGNISVLVTTTIIESGIDIPNANTIFINNAHRFGLAQLYQLRGRVGRGNRLAFAYLIVPPINQLKPDAILKLKAISRHTSLGSGYQLALHDLEIRGVGNILGIEQSGNIQAIGYDLYLKILRDAFSKLNAGQQLSTSDQEVPDYSGADIVFPFAAFIPEDYISSSSLRLNCYRRLSEAQNLEELSRIESEILDMFGKLPPEALGLLEIHRLRILAEPLSIQKIVVGQVTQIIWPKDWNKMDPESLIASIKSVASSHNWSFKFTLDKGFGVNLFFSSPDAAVEQLKLFLNSLRKTVNL